MTETPTERVSLSGGRLPRKCRNGYAPYLREEIRGKPKKRYFVMEDAEAACPPWLVPYDCTHCGYIHIGRPKKVKYTDL